MPPTHLVVVDKGPLWFPGLAGALVAAFIKDDPDRAMLTGAYGTQRWLRQTVEAAREERGVVCVGGHEVVVEALPSDMQNRFPELSFKEVGRRCGKQLQASADMLGSDRALAETVGELVRAVHALQAATDHDVSHSSPALPFSIFVSVPKRSERDSILRLSESILHEAMHLQLTLLSMHEPLVIDASSCGYSPWKDETRPVGGLLHGLYVFAVIHQVLGGLPSLNSIGSAYCETRRACIEREIGMLSELPFGLSDAGRDLWQRSRDAVLYEA